MHRLAFIVALVTLPLVTLPLASVPLVGARVARADACPPAVALSGDGALVEAVRGALTARGIAGETRACPAVRARVDRRGVLLVVAMDGPDGVAIERVVREPSTAATVIESWTRSDFAAPLLASHALPPRDDDATPAVVAQAAPPASGTHLFAELETSFASDATVWQGLQLGACVMLGPVCASARVHGGKVISWPTRWRGFMRKAAELYVGVDVPIRLGASRLTLGFAAGYGSMFTRQRDGDEEMGVEQSGPRAEAHVALAIPVSRHLALEVMTAGALTQATGIEMKGPPVDPTIVFPDEPRALLRFAIGVRYGAL